MFMNMSKLHQKHHTIKWRRKFNMRKKDKKQKEIIKRTPNKVVLPRNPI